MNLSKTDRLLLANQHEILALLEPHFADSHKQVVEALRSGYQSAIDRLFDNVFDGLSREECLEVINVMDLHTALMLSHKNLSPADQATVRVKDLDFLGYDGNDETMFMAYARYLVEHESRFTDLAQLSDGSKNDFNSHYPSRDGYSKMVDAWKALAPNNYMLSVTEVQTIVKLRPHGI